MRPQQWCCTLTTQRLWSGSTCAGARCAGCLLSTSLLMVLTGSSEDKDKGFGLAHTANDCQCPYLMDLLGGIQCFAMLQMWRVYQRGLERWIADLLQPVFDNLVTDGMVPRFVQARTLAFHFPFWRCRCREGLASLGGDTTLPCFGHTLVYAQAASGMSNETHPGSNMACRQSRSHTMADFTVLLCAEATHSGVHHRPRGPLLLQDAPAHQPEGL